jgi:hypothetical protein
MEKITNPCAQINLIDDDFGIIFVYYQYQERNLWCFGIVPFFKEDMKRKSFIALCSMLDPKF